MPKYQCAIINDEDQIGDDYVPLATVADWKSDKGFYNWVQHRRKAGAIRSKKFAATERQLRRGRVYVHRDDAAAAAVEYRAFVERKAARPGVDEAPGTVVTSGAAPETPGGCPGPDVASMAADVAVVAAAVTSLVAAVADLTAAIGLAAEAFGPQPAAAVTSFDGECGPGESLFVRLPHASTNGEG